MKHFVVWVMILVIIPIICYLFGWTPFWIAVGTEVVLFLSVSFFVLSLGLETRSPHGVSKLIYFGVVRKLTDEEKQMIDWIDQEGIGMTMPSDDGLSLKARFLKHPQSKGIVALFHGFGDYHYTSMFRQAIGLYERGYSVFLPQSRGFGKSSGHWCGMGVLEREDQLKWLNLLQKSYPDEDLFLYGVSMGAATAMNLCDANLKNFRGIIEDCGYVSLWQQESHSIKYLLQLPPFPVLYMTNMLVRLICHYSLRDLDVRKKLSKSNAPILAIHGEKDNFVPYANLALVKKYGKDKIWNTCAFPKAAHCACLESDPERYWALVSNFLENHRTKKAEESEPFSGQKCEGKGPED